AARAERRARHEPRRRDSRSRSRQTHGSRARAQGRPIEARVANAAETAPERAHSRGAPLVVAAAAWLLGTLAVHALPALPGPLWSAPLALVVLLVLRVPRAWPVL